jgi:hypothetical protein
VAVNSERMPVPGRHSTCENPGCGEPITRSDTGRRKRFCNDKCRNGVRGLTTPQKPSVTPPAPISINPLPKPPKKPSVFKGQEERKIRSMVEPDAKWPGMYRVRYPNGLSDMANWSRAYDAAREFVTPTSPAR